ncbi:CPBP family intramembrane glutamic endopeptidase [Herbidospora daliensis]|uniref:CPBP family intramembrane glutamic endopeptidase n=1 Tax=Herbidospora daliensis TaxID=295585 RepID=UPI00078497C9|nr:CPBP family intramembrane glutamic endopeptidase [Herbidospora daliensis]
MNTARRTRSPLIWLPVGLVGVGAASALASGGAALAVVAAVAATAVYWTVMRFVARRPLPELARRGAGREALAGGAVGLGFVLVSVLVITVFGGYSFTWSQGLSAVLPVVAVAIGAAVTEELLFRGLALQALEQWFGGRVALAVTAVLFGLLHLFNPGATLWSSVAIAVEAGVLLGAAFLWRRTIWFVVGLHFAWNAAEALLGIPVSGHPSEGVLTAHVSGPEWLTGGGFGLEASVVPVVVSLVIAAAMLRRARR